MTITASAAKKTRGKKFEDVPVREPPIATPNVHGVIVTGYETVRIPLPKTSKCEAVVRLAKLVDGWRFGYELKRLQGGQSGGPSVKDAAYPSRAAALEAAAIDARDYFADATKHSLSEHAEAARCRQAMHAVQEFIDGLPPSEPAVDHDAPIKGEIDLRDDEPEELPPRVPVAARSPADRELPKPIGRGVMLSLEALERHPANRTPATTDIAERAKSLQADKQLEDVVVRQLGPGRYQIISGETRCLAAASLDWTEIRCTVIECDDAEALRLVGLYNGQRTDLNPIQKAQHIEAMCAAGMTREEAGRCVGVESGSAASNLVRLLKLPKIWQDRVAAGELPESWARALLPIATIKDALDELDDAFRDREKVNGWGRIFLSRATLEHAVAVNLNRFTRRLDDTKRSYRGEYFHALGGNHDAMGDYPCLLHKDEIEANRAKLKIVTIVADGKEVEVATNCKLFDELQCAIIKQRHAEKAKKKAAAAGKKADEPTKAKAQLVKSPDMIKHEAAVRASDLKREITFWRDRLLRREVAAAIRNVKLKTAEPRLMTLVLAFLVDQSSFTSADLLPIVEESLQCHFDEHDENQYRPLAEYLNTGATLTKWQNLAAAICSYLIGGDAEDDRPAAIDSETLQLLFDEWKCDLTAAWRKLHAAKDPMLEEFFELHRKDELRTLAKEVTPDLHLAESLGKPQMLKLILGRTRPPELPKCLLPPKARSQKSGVGGQKGKRGGK